MKYCDDQWRRVDTSAGDSKEPVAEPALWFLFTNGDDFCSELHGLVENLGDRVISIMPGAKFSKINAREYNLNPGNQEEFCRLISPKEGARLPAGIRIVYMWGLACAAPGETNPFNLQSALESACAGVANLMKCLSRIELADSSVFLITRGTQSVCRSVGPVSVTQAPLWAIGADAGESIPGLRLVQIDLDLAEPKWEARTVMRDLVSLRGSGRLAYRDGERYEAAPSPTPGEINDPDPTEGLPECVQLAVRERGSLEELLLEAGERTDPGDDEIEIKVAATGLNFRDVLNAMGLFPGDAGPFGIECAGTVVRTGDAVKGFSVGDPVMAAISRTGAFRTYATVPARYVLHRPAALNPAEAATIPVAYITAIHALHDIAEISAGDRILIHAATGGVGLAAVQIAKDAGAEIFGTAGNPRKRQFLSSMGIRHVMDSRTLSFADEILQATSGSGVDIVLNGLTGEFIQKSFSVLAPGGRFIEMGKREILQPAEVSAIRNDVEYTAFDLMERAHRDPEFVGDLFKRLEGFLADDRVRPLPNEVFPLHEVIEAFRFMSKARHMGKVVVVQERNANARSPASIGQVRADGTYLVVGRMGPEGMDICRWLTARGARQLVVASPGEPSPLAIRTVEKLRRHNVRILLENVSCHVENDLANLLFKIGRTLPPVCGIIHHAFRDGVYDRGGTGPEPPDADARSAVGEVWNLHALTQLISLDLFVLASRDAGGQDLVAAGFHEALARHRRALGLPAEVVRLTIGQIHLAEALDQVFPRDEGIPPVISGRGFGKATSPQPRRSG